MEANDMLSNSPEQISEEFIENLEFNYDSKRVSIALKTNPNQHIVFDLSEPIFYFRGDTAKAKNLQEEKGLINQVDSVKNENALKFKNILLDTYKKLEQ